MPPVPLFVSSVQKELAEERRGIRDFVGGDPRLSHFLNAFLFVDLSANEWRPEGG